VVKRLVSENLTMDIFFRCGFLILETYCNHLKILLLLILHINFVQRVIFLLAQMVSPNYDEKLISRAIALHE